MEEIEEMFRNGGPKPWKTKLGESKFDERQASVAASQRKQSLQSEGKDQVVREDGTIDIVEKGGVNGVEHKGDAAV